MPRVPQGRVSLFGGVAGGEDSWSTSFAIGPQAARSQVQMQATAEAIRDAFLATYWNVASARLFHPSSVTFAGARLDDVRDPGGVVRTATGSVLVPSAGTSLAPSLPPQCTMVVSLRTGLPGPRFRGRMYLPPFDSDVLDVNGRITGAARNTFITGMASFLNSVNASAAVASTVFVASDVAQQLTAVDQIQMGNVVDTQRRRRSELVEAYVQEPITP